jgi:hydrogenase maturation factor
VPLDIDLPSDCLPEQGCITCGDTAVSMFVERVDESRGLALCATAEGARQTVETELVGEVEVGDALLVHAGVALTRLDEDSLDAPAARALEHA